MCVEMVARVVSIDGDAQTAVVEDAHGLHRVSLAVLALEGVEVSPGDCVGVHTGLAVRRVTGGAAPATRSTP